VPNPGWRTYAWNVRGVIIELAASKNPCIVPLTQPWSFMQPALVFLLEDGKRGGGAGRDVGVKSRHEVEIAGGFGTALKLVITKPAGLHRWQAV